MPYPLVEAPAFVCKSRTPIYFCLKSRSVRRMTGTTSACPVVVVAIFFVDAVDDVVGVALVVAAAFFLFHYYKIYQPEN